MHLSVNGNSNGEPKTLEVRDAGDFKVQLIITKKIRNAGNDGDELRSESIIIERKYLKKIAELMA